jgi:glutaredoxin-related protein
MRYKLFYTPTCPNCHILKEFFKTIDVDGEHIDATTPDGLNQARNFEVGSVPTVVFLEDDQVKSTATNIDEVKRVLENKTLG